MKTELVFKTSDIFGLLADPTRLLVLKVLFEGKPYCVSEIAKRLDVSMSAMSHQLARLEARGIVYCYRRGQNVCYRLSKNSLTKKIKAILATI